MSAGKALAQVNRLWQLLDKATPRPWRSIGENINGMDDEAWANTEMALLAVNALPALLELKRAAIAWALALDEIHTKTFTGPGPHYELEAFQKRERDLAELALVVMEEVE